MSKNTYIIGKYRKDDSMANLICDNDSMLLVMSRFGINLGFTDKSIDDVCRENKVDTATFLAVINLLLRQNDNNYKPILEGVSIEGIINYLHRSHEQYLNTRLPDIRKNLLNILGDDKISLLIIRYFDDYVLQINEHLEYEEKQVFPYIKKLIKGKPTDGYSIELFSDKHDNINEPLTEFKNVIIKYYNGGNSESAVSIIHDLLSCARDLLSHNIVEDKLLVPLIRKIEN